MAKRNRGLSEPSKALNEILLERRDAPPKDPWEAVVQPIVRISRALLKREAREDREEQALDDFDSCVLELVNAAAEGGSAEDQGLILQRCWQEFEFPIEDLRKRREPHGPVGEKLLAEFEPLLKEVESLFARRKTIDHADLLSELREFAPRATPKAREDAAKTGPIKAARILIGSKYGRSERTIEKRLRDAHNEAE